MIRLLKYSSALTSALTQLAATGSKLRGKVTVPDPRGSNPKKRPVVVLTSDEELKKEDVFVGIVCSHSAAIAMPLPASSIQVPYHPNGLCRTRLHKPTVAIVGWYAEVSVASIADDDIGGVVPPAVLASIIRAVVHDREGYPPS